MLGGKIVSDGRHIAVIYLAAERQVSKVTTLFCPSKAILWRTAEAEERVDKNYSKNTLNRQNITSLQGSARLGIF